MYAMLLSGALNSDTTRLHLQFYADRSQPRKIILRGVVFSEHADMFFLTI